MIIKAMEMHHGPKYECEMRVHWKIPSFIRIGRHRIMLSIPISSSAASNILQNMFFFGSLVDASRFRN